MSEISHTDQYRAILRDVRETIDAQKGIVVNKSHTEELAKIRYEAGVLDGMLSVLRYLEEQ